MQTDEYAAYGPLRLQQLQLAHASSVLMYVKNDARDTEKYVKELARKLRPEFGHFYHTEDVKECFKMLAKCNHGEEGVKPIDVVILDFDTQSIKLLDMINKRSSDPKTAHLPLISTIVILPLEEVGGYLAEGGTTQPQPQLGNKTQEDKQQGSSEGFDPKQLISAAGGCNAMQGHNVSSKQMLYCALDALYRRKLVEGSYREIKIVKSVSSKYPYFPLFSSGSGGSGGGGGETRLPVTGEDEALHGEGIGEEESGREAKSSSIRRKTLSALASASASAAAVSASSSIAGSTKSLHTMTDWTDSSSMLPDFVKEQRKGYREKNSGDVKLLGPTEPRQRHEMDEILLEQLNKSRSGGGGGGVATAADDDFSRMSADTAPSVAHSLLLPTSTARGKAPACSRLLDTRRRPTFNAVREGPGGVGSGGSVPPGTSVREREDPSDEGPAETIDLRVFFDKPPPSLQAEHTVGGLDRAVAASSWKVLNAHVTGAKSAATKKLPPVGQHSNNTTSTGGSISGSASIDPSQSQSQVHQQQQHHHHHHSRGPAPKEVDNATKVLKRMARDNAPDVQVHNLLDVELAHGKVAMGDRDLLESGMKLEKEGNEDQAIFLYTRAGIQSKSPHLSKLFLGNIHFRMGKFMAALKFFAEALHSLEEARLTAQFSSEDYFVANFNRGVTNFRVGNDEQGLVDLEMAVSICPDHLMAKEVLAVAMRRMGFYKATIECCKQTRALRQDVKIAAEAAAAAAAAAALAKKKARQFTPSSSSTSASIGSKNSNKQQKESSRSGVSSLGANSLHSLTAAEEASHSLKTIFLPLGESSSMDLKARKALAQKQVIESESSGAMPGEALRAFKVMNSFPLDLYDGLFVKPSSLQSALAVPPELRSSADLDVICTTLRLFPFLRPVPDLIVREVARCVEYRAVVEKGVLYAQDTPCEGLCFLLSGTMQARLDVESSVGASSTHVGDVPQYGAVGYTDLLFSNPNSPQVRSLMKMCKDRNDSLTRKAAAPGPAEEKDAERSTTTGAAFKSAEVGGDKGTVSGAGLEAAGDGDDEQSDDELEETMLPRALRSGMFTTYFMSTICELLLVSEADFIRYLYPYAAEDLRKRISVLKSSCVFQDWRTEDLIRLARMGRVQTFRTGEVILTQGDLPSFCYFILKGMCKSYKRPNKCEILDKRLTEAKHKAEHHDLKYMFHAGLRHTLSKGSAGKLEAFRQHQHQHQHLHHHKHLTEAEVDRHNLGAHISRLEHELARAKAHEAKLAEEEEANDEEKESVTKKLVEVSTLQWPMLFGEACVQDPDNGFSRGTIIADTTCDILMIHKIQMQTFKVSSSLLDRFTGHSIFYPTDEALVASSERDEAWETARVAIVSGLWRTPDPIPIQPFRV